MKCLLENRTAFLSGTVFFLVVQGKDGFFAISPNIAPAAAPEYVYA